jgi:tetratricopeptide (TPR) repeat protein
MSIRAKTKHRLTILLVVALVISGVVGVYVFVRYRQLQAEVLTWREQGLAAADDGNYGDALGLLEQYLEEIPDDMEVTFRTAKILTEMPMSNRKPLTKAIEYLRRVRGAQPNHIEAIKLLLSIYSRNGYDSETLSLSEELLSKSPDNPQAFGAKARALSSMRKLDEALGFAEKCNQSTPLDYPNQLLTLEILFKLNRPIEQVAARVDSLQQTYPDDPWFMFMQAYVQRVANNRNEAIRWLRAAATRPPPSAEFTEYMISEFDRIQLFDESLAYLEKAASDHSEDPRFQLMLINRLLQADRVDLVLQRFESMAQASKYVDTRLLAFRAMALLRTNRANDAQPLVTTLVSRRKEDPQAKVWAPVLTELVQQIKPDPKRLIDLCNESLARDPYNPYIKYFLADAYLSIGEQELALAAYRGAAVIAPAWSLPYVGMAKVYASTTGYRNAYEAYAQALIRSPRNMTAAIGLVKSWNSLLNTAALRGTEERLLELIDQIQAGVPMEEQTLAVKVQVLAQSGRKEEAVEVLRQMLASPTPISDSARVGLTDTSRKFGLGMEQELLQAAPNASSPAIVYAKAMDCYARNDPAAGRQLIESSLQASQGEDQMTWKMVLAQYLEKIKDPSAKDNWASLSKEKPDDLPLQRAVLDAPSAWADRDLIARTIERVKTLGGEQGLAWRLAKVRWLIEGDNIKKDAQEAAGLLTDILRAMPDRVEPRLYFASCMEALGNPEGAIENLNIAANLAPDSNFIAINLARLQQSQGDFEHARQNIDRVAKSPNATPGDLKQVAYFLAKQGDTSAAIANLVQSYVMVGQGDLPPDLMLAELYRKSGDPGKAEAIYLKLLENPTSDAIRSAAFFYGSIGRLPEAQQVLAKLDSIALKPGIKQLILAEYANQIGDDPKQAIDYLLDATRQAPDDSTIWQALVVVEVQTGDIKAALESSRQAIRSVSNHETFSFLVSQSDLLQSIETDKALHPLILALIQEPEYRSPAIEVISLLADAKKTNQKVSDLIPSVRLLAERNSKFLLLQNALVNLYCSVGEFNNAVTIANRTMEAFPQVPQQTQKVAETLAMAGRWSEAINVASRWRQQSPDRPMKPDMMIAESQIRLGNAKLGLAQLKPYASFALANPNQYFSYVAQYCRALILTGQVQEAIHIMSPLLSNSEAWRGVWGSLAVQLLPVPQAAEWLKQLDPLVPQDAFEERFNLAEAWHALARRSQGDPAYWRYLYAFIDQVISQPNAPAMAYALAGTYHDESGDRAAAAHYYRKAIEIDPKAIVSQNNLAMIIVDLGGDLQEARKLAENVVEQSPRAVPYLDTLAQVYARLADYPNAVTTMHRAITLDPKQPVWKISLVGFLIEAQQWQEADKWLDKIELEDVPTNPLSDDLRARVQALRVRLDQQTATAVPAP